MVAVPAGGFTLGCTPANGGCRADDSPPVEVHLSAFAIDKTEVTNEAYAAFLGERGNTCGPEPCLYEGTRNRGRRHPILTRTSEGGWTVTEGREAYPVELVTWYGATAYCSWVGRRLPTEAEWEKAARGADARFYPWGSAEPSCELANYADCAERGEADTVPVGSLPAGASPYGALDMAGNVREWVADRYDIDYYSTAPKVDPTGPDEGFRRSIRGGKRGNAGSVWDRRFGVQGGEHLRAFYRDSGQPSFGTAFLGFRCAASIEPSDDAAVGDVRKARTPPPPAPAVEPEPETAEATPDPGRPALPAPEPVDGCEEFANHISVCKPFSCRFPHPLDPGFMVQRTVFGRDGMDCYSEETMPKPDDAVLRCRYPFATWDKVAEAYEPTTDAPTAATNLQKHSEHCQITCPECAQVD